MTTTQQLMMHILSSALNASMANQKLPDERDTVAKAAPHVLSELCDIYTGKQKSAERFSLVLFDLVECLFDVDDEIVKLIGPSERQQLWAVLSMLNAERRKNGTDTTGTEVYADAAEPNASEPSQTE
jgi:hypothetical protein